MRRHSPSVRITILASAVLGASCQRGPTDADRREIARLQAVRDTLRIQMDAIDAEPFVSRESLLGAIRSVRVQLLHTTDDLVRQRSEALAAGAEFKYQETAFRPDSVRAESLSRVIRDARDSLSAAEQRAGRMSSGSLLAAMAQTQVQTQRLTIDMLEMTRLSALYGIGLPALKVDSSSSIRQPR